MSKNLNFNIDCELDTTHLHYILNECIRNNTSDAEIIARLQNEYKASNWFTVIAFAEQVIYG